LKDFFYSLSNESLQRRFMSMKKSIPHERLQEMVVINYTRDMIILAVIVEEDIEEVIGIGRSPNSALMRSPIQQTWLLQ
jgi:hypothetical protein